MHIYDEGVECLCFFNCRRHEHLSNCMSSTRDSPLKLLTSTTDHSYRTGQFTSFDAGSLLHEISHNVSTLEDPGLYPTPAQLTVWGNWPGLHVLKAMQAGINLNWCLNFLLAFVDNFLFLAVWTLVLLLPFMASFALQLQNIIHLPLYLKQKT